MNGALDYSDGAIRMVEWYVAKWLRESELRRDILEEPHDLPFEQVMAHVYEAVSAAKIVVRRQVDTTAAAAHPFWGSKSAFTAGGITFFHVAYRSQTATKLIPTHTPTDNSNIKGSKTALLSRIRARRPD